MKKSLRWRLAAWLSACIVVVAVVAGVFSFLETMDDVHELQDDFLRQTALIAANQANANADTSLITNGFEGYLDEEESLLMIQWLDEETPQDAYMSLPNTLHNGLQTIHLGDTSYRVMVKQLQNGKRVAVAQETKLRNEIALDSALHTVLPLVLLIPILVLLTIFIVHHTLRPLQQLAQEVESRNDAQLHPLPQQDLPTEITPFVKAINKLLSRVERSVAAQNRFVADAAHELRSPLTALSLQAHRLSQSSMSEQAQERLASLQEGILRSKNLLEQLLALARSQSQPNALQQRIAVADLYRNVLEELMPLAEAKHIDLGMAEVEDMHIYANELDAHTMMKNLVSNAIHYTPEGGQIDLSAKKQAQHAVLEVEDNGTGIPAHERERVLDPFYRIAGSGQTGSGLGLSIVKAIVERCGGKLTLSDAHRFSTGLRVTVELPLPKDEGETMKDE